jgi:lipoprotein-anchoring transpeptidase ErfK/SrfK
MRVFAFIRPVLALAAVLSFAAPAAATVAVSIDLATQHMHVQSADHTYDWPISSAREGYVTPDGTFAPVSMFVDYHSKKYDNAPMPHAIFFYYGFAIHGTNETRELGRPASHGCVRLSRANAATLFALVKAEGASIVISGAPAGQPLNPVATQVSANTSGSGNIFGKIFGN